METFTWIAIVMDIFTWIAIVGSLLLGIFLGRRKTKTGSTVDITSTPAVHHEVEMEIIQSDIIADAIADHDVDPEVVNKAIDLADRKRF